MSPRLNSVSFDWSSMRFWRRSIDQICQSGLAFTMSSASGTKYADPAEVPGSRTRTFGASRSPTSSTPTLLNSAGVPGDWYPSVHSTERSVAAGLVPDPAVDDELADPSSSDDEHPAANRATATADTTSNVRVRSLFDDIEAPRSADNCDRPDSRSTDRWVNHRRTGVQVG